MRGTILFKDFLVFSLIALLISSTVLASSSGFSVFAQESDSFAEFDERKNNHTSFLV